MTINSGRKAISLILGMALVMGIWAFLGAKGVFSDPPWPTPPPAPPAPRARIIPLGQITEVALPSVTGASSVVLHPISGGPVPRIPPLRSVTFDSYQDVRLISEAGSLLHTVQVVYAPVSMSDAPSPDRHQILLRTFDLFAYDHQAKLVSPPLVRPWVLEVRLEELELGQAHPSQLLLARFDSQSKRWAPLVTSYFPSKGLLMAKILDVGRFAIMAEPMLAPLDL